MVGKRYREVVLSDVARLLIAQFTGLPVSDGSSVTGDRYDREILANIAGFACHCLRCINIDPVTAHDYAEYIRSVCNSCQDTHLYSDTVSMLMITIIAEASENHSATLAAIPIHELPTVTKTALHIAEQIAMKAASDAGSVTTIMTPLIDAVYPPDKTFNNSISVAAQKWEIRR